MPVPYSDVVPVRLSCPVYLSHPSYPYKNPEGVKVRFIVTPEIDTILVPPLSAIDVNTQLPAMGDTGLVVGTGVGVDGSVVEVGVTCTGAGVLQPAANISTTKSA